MLNVISQVTLTQVPSDVYPTRTKQLCFKAIAELNADDGWEDLTKQATITLPKVSVQEIKNEDLQASTAVGSKIHLGNTNTNLGGFSSNPPKFMRGDQVTIVSGYSYNNGNNVLMPTATLFQGFISQVTGGKPFVIECEDFMWKLKQFPAKGGVNGVFAYTDYNVDDILQELITNAGLNYNVNPITVRNLGIDFRVDKLTIAQVIEKLRRDAFILTYFRVVNGVPELRCGSTVYTDYDSSTYNFDFQKNIISNDLDYQRRDDVILSAIGTSVNIVTTGETTKDGEPKTQTQKLEVFCTYQNDVFTSVIKLPGSDTEFPSDIEGERHTFEYNNITDPNDLINETKMQLWRYYYTGYRGTFTTFGIPFVRMGDNVALTDAILPERNGTYKVKKVAYKLSVDGGLRQVIKLDFKVE